MALKIIVGLFLIIEIIYYYKLVSSKDNNKVEYFRDIPSSKSPAQVGLLVKGKVDGNDIISTLLDLNMRGFIEIENRYIDNQEKCVLKLVPRERILSLNEYENFLINQVFKDNTEVIFDDYLKYNNTQEMYNAFNIMVKKRITDDSVHKISWKKNIFKINFIVCYLLFGLSLFYPIFQLIFRNFEVNSVIISLVLGFMICILFFMLYNSFVNNSRLKLDKLILEISYPLIFIFGIIIIAAYFIDKNISFDSEIYFQAINILFSILTIYTFISSSKKERNITFEFLFIVYSIISMIFNNTIGAMIGIVYFSLRSYQIAPKHINYKDGDEVTKWLALKKYLNDFTIIGEREMQEVKMWEKYLIYAISLGVNKKCIEEYTKLSHLKILNENIINKFYIENIDF